MAEQGAFADLPPAEVASAHYIGLGAKPVIADAPLADEPPAKVWAEFRALIAAWLEEDRGFTSRRMMQKETDTGHYDHLARYGEWDATQDPAPEVLE